jgi:hypothetical protein
MRRTLIALLLASPLSIATAAAGPYYVRGTFYCHPGVNDPAPGSTCWGWDAGNEMFDDGLHNDGQANDGVHGADIVCTEPAGRLEFKVATTDWSESYPTHPSFPLANAVVFTTGPGDVIHFTFDTRVMFEGWQPFFNSVATDHALPAGATLEAIGSAPELGSWNSGIPLHHVGSRWQRFVTIATPGEYEFKFRVTGTWDVAAFGYDYNNTSGRNAFLTTTFPNSDVFLQLDELTGRIRALELGPTQARRTSWSRLKSLYR